MQDRRDGVAQALYTAQLEALQSDCECNTCKLLRKASKGMTELALAEPDKAVKRKV